VVVVGGVFLILVPQFNVFMTSLSNGNNLWLTAQTVPLLFSLRILMLDFNLGPYDVYSKVPEQVMPKKSQGSRQAATAG